MSEISVAITMKNTEFRKALRHIGDGFALFSNVRGEVDDPDSPYIVQMTVSNASGTPELEELVVRRRPGGVPLTAELVRKHIRVREYVDRIAYHVVLEQSGSGDAVIVTPLGADEADRARKAIERDQKRGRRRTPDEELRRFALIVHRAQATGASYIKAAELEMGLTIDQAKQWKRRATAAGYLEWPDNEVNL